MLPNPAHPSLWIWSMPVLIPMIWTVKGGLPLLHLNSDHPFAPAERGKMVHLPVDCPLQFIHSWSVTKAPTQSSNHSHPIKILWQSWLHDQYNSFFLSRIHIITKWTASLVARFRMSAQETTPGQRSSRTILILSMRINPPRPEFCGAVFSVFGPSSRIDASQPYSTLFTC